MRRKGEYKRKQKMEGVKKVVVVVMMKEEEEEEEKWEVVEVKRIKIGRRKD